MKLKNLPVVTIQKRAKKTKRTYEHQSNTTFGGGDVGA